MGKREIGYYISSGGQRQGSVSIQALGDVTGEELRRVAVGIVIGGWVGIKTTQHNEGLVNIASGRDRKNYGGAALKEKIASEAAGLRDLAKSAIRLAGFKPVKL